MFDLALTNTGRFYSTPVSIYCGFLLVLICIIVSIHQIIEPWINEKERYFSKEVRMGHTHQIGRNYSEDIELLISLISPGFRVVSQMKPRDVYVNGMNCNSRPETDEIMRFPNIDNRDENSVVNYDVLFEDCHVNCSEYGTTLDSNGEYDWKLLHSPWGNGCVLGNRNTTGFISYFADQTMKRMAVVFSVTTAGCFENYHVNNTHSLYSRHYLWFRFNQIRLCDCNDGYIVGEEVKLISAGCYQYTGEQSTFHFRAVTILTYDMWGKLVRKERVFELAHHEVQIVIQSSLTIVQINLLSERVRVNIRPLVAIAAMSRIVGVFGILSVGLVVLRYYNKKHLQYIGTGTIQEMEILKTSQLNRTKIDFTSPTIQFSLIGGCAHNEKSSDEETQTIAL